VSRDTPGGVIEVQPLKGTKRAISTTVALSCSTKVSASSDGSAELRYAGGTAATCQLSQDDPARTATLISRDQPNDFFQLGEGKIACTWPPSSPNESFSLCGVGTLLISGKFQGEATCHADPFFQVKVLAGSARVTAPGLNIKLTAGQELTFDLSTHAHETEAAQFTVSDVAELDAQARGFGLPITPAPQAITFTSTPPANPAINQTYTVAATGGGSGNTVQFTIDPSSESACTISGQTVTFTSDGACTIDANQAGNRQFQAAQQKQQSIPVSAPAAPAPQAITFTSTPPANPAIGLSYTVAATGGASGNTVQFTIDPSSEGACTISGQTVTFTDYGTCTIDANQAGNQQFQAAQQKQQSILISPPH
jgi:hypothetical protein